MHSGWGAGDKRTWRGGRRRLGRGLSWFRVAAATSGLAMILIGGAAQSISAAGSQPLSESASGNNGVGSIVNPGLSCANGGEGNYRDYLMTTTVPGGVVSSLAGNLRANLDVQHDGTEPPVGPVTNNAFLLGNISHATFSNQRGALQLALSSGTCAKPTLPFDGTTVSGSGTWAIDPASDGNTGSYRQATGSGTFTLRAGVAPGADNPWSLVINGSMTVLQPSMSISVVNTFWGNLGLDYAVRNVSVTYRVTNTGLGDSFGDTLVSTSSSTPGVHPLGITPQPLGDLAAGASTTVTVRYHLDLLAPCTLVILNCNFNSTLTATMPDALDVPSTQTASAPVTAPALPPPL
jgi:hypothetical protein